MVASIMIMEIGNVVLLFANQNGQHSSHGSSFSGMVNGHKTGLPYLTVTDPPLQIKIKEQAGDVGLGLQGIEPLILKQKSTLFTTSSDTSLLSTRSTLQLGHSLFRID